MIVIAIFYLFSDDYHAVSECHNVGSYLFTLVI